MTASVQGYERRRDVFESLLVRELVRARRVESARPPRAPDPATCLVTRAQLMQRELSRAHEHAIGLLEDACNAVQDDAVSLQLTATTNLARELTDLMELADIDLVSLLAEQMGRLRAAGRERLFAIASACAQTDRTSIAKLMLVGENYELRKALSDAESASTLLSRVLYMNSEFDTLCSLEPARK